MTGVESVGDPIMVLPVLFHLLWWQELVTDLSQATPPAVSPPAFLAAAARQYWGIEAVHWIRDVTWGEDHQHAYTGSGVHTLATFRNVALTILRLRGVTQIRRTLQHLHRNPADALALLNPAAT